MNVTFTKATPIHGRFSRFLHCTNGTKSHEVSHMFLKNRRSQMLFTSKKIHLKILSNLQENSAAFVFKEETRAQVLS